MSPRPLYMVGADTDKLYTLHPWTGAATPVGNATAFGAVNETEPRGLANLNGTLYMVGATNDALYRLNTSTGVATQVGNATQFGVSEGEPTGISTHGGILYMAGAGTDALYALDTATGEATQVGSVMQFDVSEDGPSGLAWHQGTLYMVSSETDRLYSIDSATGVATAVGSATQFGVSEAMPTGMASHSIGEFTRSTLFLIGSDTDKLWILNPDDGEAENVEIPNLGFQQIGSRFHMVSYNGALYAAAGSVLYTLDPSTGTATSFLRTDLRPYSGISAMGSHNGSLYVTSSERERDWGVFLLNLATGVTMRIGQVGNFGAEEDDPVSLVSHGNSLYMLGDRNKRLYVLNTLTGIATAVGNRVALGLNNISLRGAVLASHNGTLYMAIGSTLYTLDTTTGEATEVTDIGRDDGTDFVAGMASHNSILYAIAYDSLRGNVVLRELDAQSGELTKTISNITQFGVGEGDPQGLASAP